MARYKNAHGIEFVYRKTTEGYTFRRAGESREYACTITGGIDDLKWWLDSFSR